MHLKISSFCLGLNVLNYNQNINTTDEKVLKAMAIWKKLIRDDQAVCRRQVVSLGFIISNRLNLVCMTFIVFPMKLINVTVKGSDRWNVNSFLAWCI